MEDISFPRGGRERKVVPAEEEKKTKHSNKRKTQTVASDFLFGSSNDKETSKSKKIKTKSSSNGSSSKHSLLPLGGGGVVMLHQGKKQEPLIESLSYSKLAKGSKLLGYVREVHEDFAVLSLPNLLTGYMLQEGTPLTKCVSIGQCLAVVIVKIVTEHVAGGQQRRRIQLSAKPTALNAREEPSKNITVRGQVTSVEDHGCLVDLGLGRKGFLPFTEVEGDHVVLDDDEEADDDEKGRILQSGRLHDFFVTSASDAVYSLSLPSPETLVKTLLVPGKTVPSLASIAPGWLVQAKMESLAKNGLCVSFFGNVFRGAVEIAHIGGYFSSETREPSTAWRDVFNKHQSFKARIIAVDVATKLIRLSLQPHLLEMKVPEGLPDVGATVENCRVVRLDPGIGALLALPEEYNKEADNTKPKDLFTEETYREAARVNAVYVHISKAIDENDAALFAKQFVPSTTHDVRILSSMNWIEGVASGACAPSIISAHVLTHSDLKPGQIYRQVPICAHLNGGSILVNLGTGVRGLIPPIHLFETSASSEYRRKLLKAKFSVESKIDVRVLWVNVAKKKCLLTAKKSLVKDNETIAAYEGVKIGQTASGFISKIDDKALFVTFCNRVYGKVTARSLAAELGIEDHQQHYSVGDVVACRVVNIKKKAPGTMQTKFENENEDGYEDDEEEEDNGRAYYELTLSLKVQLEDVDEQMQDVECDPSRIPKLMRVRAGAILPLKSMKIVEFVKGKQKEKGGFVPGYAIVSVKSKYLVDEAEAATMPPYTECKLPYDQLMDDYRSEDIESAEALDTLAEGVLTVGKKISQKGIILTDPRKSDVDYANAIGDLTVLSLRKKLIEAATAQYAREENSPGDIIVPSPDTDLFVGALLMGYVTQVDARHGSFIRFFERMTGLIPKTKGGLDMPLYGTVVTRIEAIDDKKRPMKILLKSVASTKHVDKETSLSLQQGDVITEAKVIKVDFYRASLKVLDHEYGKNVYFSIHCSMKDSVAADSIGFKKQEPSSVESAEERPILKGHPFFKVKAGKKLTDLTVASVEKKKNAYHVYLTDRKIEDSKAGARDGTKSQTELAVVKASTSTQLTPGMIVSGIVTGIAPGNKGVYLQLNPTVSGFIPALELSATTRVLNNLKSSVTIGSRLRCCVIDEKEWRDNRSKCPVLSQHKGKTAVTESSQVYLSLLAGKTEKLSDAKMSKPTHGDLIIGRINRSLPHALPPSLMLDLKGGFVGRCCITETKEVDDWINMPLGRISEPSKDSKKGDNAKGKGTNKSKINEDMELSAGPQEEVNKGDETSDSPYPHGRFVRVRVLKAIPGQSIVDVSLRPSRIEGDLDDDEKPEVGDTVQGYVVHTNKSGCFVRLARHIQARVILKELCDGFLPDPASSFPMGRLVVGRVKEVREAPKKSKKAKDPIKFQVDLDMRESTLLEDQNKLKFDDVELDGKYKGTVTRVEDYGVFVRLENSDVSGLVHKSECSDNYVKNLGKLYDPGDLVKVVVVKKEDEERRLGFSMKASHFADDDESDEDSSIGDSSEERDVHEMNDVNENEEDELDSDDDNFVSKLAAMTGKDDDKNTSDSSSSSDDDSDSDDDEKSKNVSEELKQGKKDKKTKAPKLDTDVGFDWGTRGSSCKGKKKDGDDSSDDDTNGSGSDDDDDAVKSSHKSRKKQAQRRRDEQDITRRETALADGTADANPETAADFERLLAGNPNASELWIRYMAFHLSLADIPSARAVAERAFQRIEFRQEKEKLNVWTALLTLEHKYGSDDSLQATVERACQHNNPKQVHLRVCEILEKDAEATSSADAAARADSMFAKMCKRFKSKKKVWIAHLQYLLKLSRHEEAHALLKRALMSLASYKHAETMSKFAQLEFEFGSAERARTVFDGILIKYSKRLDLFFVYLDKEVKFGTIEAARTMLQKKVHPPDGQKNKLSDKQMKSLFKKWYRIEEQYGSDETRERVKEEARSYVEQSSN